MESLDSLTVYHGSQEKYIELYQGDLTELTPEESFDVLVVSAFPGSYTPTTGTLIRALAKKSVQVAGLANDKAVDLRDSFSCWLSQKITAAAPGIQFKRIMCFEPQRRGTPPQVIGDIFQSLVAFVSEDPSIKEVAMPLVATGAQRTPISELLPPLIEAAVHWLSIGLPLERLKIVAYSPSSAAEVSKLFPSLKAKYATFPSPKQEPKQEDFKYDVFVSYAHKNNQEVSHMIEQLQKLQPDLRIFLDRQELKVGCAWQQALYDALDSCRKVIAVYSPEYITSKVCKEEFNIALYRDRDSAQGVLFPIYLYTANLPTYMKVMQFIDCREANKDQLQSACREFLAQLAGKASPKAVSQESQESEESSILVSTQELHAAQIVKLTSVTEQVESKLEQVMESLTRLESKVDNLSTQLANSLNKQ